MKVDETDGEESVNTLSRTDDGHVQKALWTAAMPGALIGLASLVSAIFVSGWAIWWVGFLEPFNLNLLSVEMVLLSITSGMGMTVLGSAIGPKKAA